MSPRLNTFLLVLAIVTASLLSTVAPDDMRVEQATADSVDDLGVEGAQVVADAKFAEVSK